MKHVAAVFACLLLILGRAECQQHTLTPALKDLIASPQSYDEKAVKVQGFLVIEAEPRHAPLVILYSSKDSAERHATSSGVLVIPSSALIHERRRINLKYVNLVGTCHAVGPVDGSYTAQLEEIKAFDVEESSVK